MGVVLHDFWFLKYDIVGYFRSVLGDRIFVMSLTRFSLTVFDLNIKVDVYHSL